MGEKRGGGETVKAAADDQNGDVVVHGCSPDTNGFPARAAYYVALNNVIDKTI
jgi:hypothetical protein